MAQWTLLGFGATQLIRLGSNLVLSRILAPESFGVLSLAYAVVIAITMLSDMGISPALVQRKEALSSRFVNTLWTVQVAHGIGVGCMMLVSAGLVVIWQSSHMAGSESSFSSPELPGVLLLLAAAPVMAGLTSSKIVSAAREMQVSRAMLLLLAESLVATVVSLCLAFWLGSVYALPIGIVAGNAVRAWTSHRFLPGATNEFCWDKAALAELHHFGKWIFISTALAFAVNGGDRLLLGAYVTSREMGLYAIAFLLATTAQTLINKISSVGLPLFSEIARERPHELAQIFHRTRLPIDLLSMFAAGTLAGGASLVVKLMYDARYAGAADMLVALSMLVVAARYDLLASCWTAMGITKRLTLLSFARLVTLLIGLPLGHALGGAVGASWGIAAAAMVNHPVGWWFMHQSKLLDWRKEARSIPLFLLGYALAAGVTHLMA